MNAHELKALIDYHDDLYYNQGTPEISDAEYDALRQRLLELDKDMLDYVPGGSTGLFPKYEHTHPIASLAKVNTEEGLRKEAEKLLPVVVMPKFDGLTVVTYPDAQVTRGNGSVGDDISVNFNKVCRETYPIPVRGEAIIKRDDFIALNALRKKNGEEEFKNARNAAAGILRSKDGNYMEYISYVVYEAVGSTLSLTEDLALLETAGFRTTDYWEFNNVDDLVSFIMDFDKNDYMYELDGLVIKTNQPDSEARFGRTSHHPKNAFAYKFQAQGEWTKLLSVTNQVGRTGKVTPVAELAPVELMGSTITRATLHNYSIMDALRLSQGCDVFLIKANDVIPAIIESNKFNPLAKFKPPTHCPVCESELELVKDQLFCRNVHCETKILGRIEHMAKRDALDITGLSEQTAIKIIESGKVAEPEDIFELTLDDIKKLPGFGEKSAMNLYQNIQTARTASFDRFVYSVGIPLIGRSASKDMAKIYSSYDEFLNDYKNKFALLRQVEGFGETMIASLIKHFDLLVAMKDKMFEVQFKKIAVESSESFSICITGTLEKPRSYYQELIESHNHKFVSSVTKKTTHLLAGEKAGSKLKKAEGLGIKILRTEEELLELLRD